MKPYVLCDLDGTASDPAHRLHHVRGPGRKNWSAFFAGCGDDACHEDIAEILRALLAPGRRVIYVTGRPERNRRATLEWLKRHGFPEGPLHMRADRDHRADDVVKEEILDRDLRLDPSQVLCVLDDRDRVVAMWRRRGFRVLQVAEGDF
ncbi:MAG TPA: hypothetical protein VEA81_10630 [Burkholderiaceae bacterium]|nr:hypothetical protein [Burkholderiaceae bacterium]